MVSPHFFLKKLTTFFSHRRLKKRKPSLAVVSSPLRPSLPSNIFVQFSLYIRPRKVNLIRVSPPPGWCHLGRSTLSPPPYAHDILTRNWYQKFVPENWYRNLVPVSGISCRISLPEIWYQKQTIVRIKQNKFLNLIIFPVHYYE